MLTNIPVKHNIPDVKHYLQGKKHPAVEKSALKPGNSSVLPLQDIPNSAFYSIAFKKALSDREVNTRINKINELKRKATDNFDESLAKRLEEVILKGNVPIKQAETIFDREICDFIKNNRGARNTFNDLLKHYNNEPSDWSVHERKIITTLIGDIMIKNYTDWEWSELNTALRQKTINSDPNLKVYNRELSKALNLLPDYQGEVVRFQDNIDELPRLKELMRNGKAFTLNQYWSTSKHLNDSTRYHKSYKLIINAKRGKDVSILSHFPQEKEVILKPGSEFKIKSITDSRDQTIIKMEEI